MLSNIYKTLTRLKWLILIMAFLYIASIGAGIITRYAGGEAFVSFVEKTERSKAEQVEKLFGRFREAMGDVH